jgi:hypothetical protein
MSGVVAGFIDGPAQSRAIAGICDDREAAAGRRNEKIVAAAIPSPLIREK